MCGQSGRSTGRIGWAATGPYGTCHGPVELEARHRAAEPSGRRTDDADTHGLTSRPRAMINAPRSGPAHARAVAHRAPGPSRPCPPVPENDLPRLPPALNASGCFAEAGSRPRPAASPSGARKQAPARPDARAPGTCSRREPTVSAACPGTGLGSLESIHGWTEQRGLRHCTEWGRWTEPGWSR
jgi:hypothetical protein